MHNMIQKFLQDERGATSIEYGLIAAGIGVAVVTLVSEVGTEVQSIFQDILTRLEGFTPPTTSS